MDNKNQLTNIDIKKLIQITDNSYFNQVLTQVNDHVVRVSVMYEPFVWHKHPNSDETFLVLEGEVLLELDEQLVTLLPGQVYTVPCNTPHKTSPVGPRSINLTIEHIDLQTTILPV